MSRMAIEKILDQANKVDSLVYNLKQQVQFLRSSLIANNVKKWEDENLKLKKEVEDLKTELTLTEIYNGVRQVYVPANIANVTSPSNVVKEIPSLDAINGTSTTEGHTISKKEEVVEATSLPTASKSAKKAKPTAAPPENDKIDVSRLDMRVGKIVEVDRHPDADTLYVEQVDVGETSNRTVVSGLVKHIPIDQMKNRIAIFMCNLKPAKVRGVLSQAMIMCASRDGKTEILNPPDGSQIGDKITVPEYPGTPDTQLNPKKKIWEQVKPDLLTNEKCEATYKGARWLIGDKGPVKAHSVSDGQIS